MSEEEMISVKTVAEHSPNDFACPDYYKLTKGDCVKEKNCSECLIGKDDIKGFLRHLFTAMEKLGKRSWKDDTDGSQ